MRFGCVLGDTSPVLLIGLVAATAVVAGAGLVLAATSPV